MPWICFGQRMKAPPLKFIEIGGFVAPQEFHGTIPTEHCIVAFIRIDHIVSGVRYKIYAYCGRGIFIRIETIILTISVVAGYQGVARSQA